MSEPYRAREEERPIVHGEERCDGRARLLLSLLWRCDAMLCYAMLINAMPCNAMRIFGLRVGRASGHPTHRQEVEEGVASSPCSPSS